MEPLTIYNAVRNVPQEAQKSINGGRLRGMTDINPMWRIKTLTEQFGPCGFGWKYVIRDKRLEVGANGEIAAFLDIDLYIKFAGEWSEAIPGTGGSSFITKEKNGLYMSDECFKMALTDAISVACKALGFGADVYWKEDKSKYGSHPKQPEQPAEPVLICSECGKPILQFRLQDGRLLSPNSVKEYSQRRFEKVLCGSCIQKRKQNVAHQSDDRATA